MADSETKTKKCQKCRKLLDISIYTNEKGDILGKCSPCRIKLVKTTNICKVCGIKAIYNFEGEKNAICCYKHKEVNMINIKHKKCETKGCKKYPVFNFEGKTTPSFCSEHKEVNMIDIKNKKCETKGCKKQPNFNFEGEKNARFCSDHKEVNMIDIKHKKCETKGCKKQPVFNFEGETTPRFCSDHKEVNMIDIKSKTCEAKGCKKQPTFNFEGEKNARFCSEHKEVNMIDIKHKTCETKGCKKQPIFNFEGETTPRFCSDHKEANMIDIKNKTCETKGCKKRPNFNFEGMPRARFCSDHKEVNMIDIKNKTCETKGCKKQPTFNFEGEKNARFCSDHKEVNMINIKSKTCEAKDCKRIPTFNFDGKKNARFCSDHKEVNMIDIKHKKCETKGCKLRASYGLPGTSVTHCSKDKLLGMIIKPTKRCSEDCKEPATHGLKEPLFCEQHADKDHYNLCEQKCTNTKCPYPGRLDILNREGLCVTFCSLIKKDQMMKKYIKKKEEFIGNLLKEDIKQELSHCDEIIDSSCSKVRPDFVFDCGTHVVIIEVDEHQHRSYSNCGNTKEERTRMENRRMFMIFQSFGGPRTIFIRYNPDVFRVNDKIVNVSDKKRHELLLRWVKHYLKNGTEFPMEVKYLFYDEYDEACQKKIIITESDII
jgi:hypothetical protein